MIERLQIFKTEGSKQSSLTYNPYFDSAAYRQLDRGGNEQQKVQLNSYTRRQLETYLGERLNVVLSKNKYEIRGAEIYGENTDVPFADVIKRGIERRRVNGNPVDFEREEAELVGFLKIQKTLADNKTEPETVMISVS